MLVLFSFWLRREKSERRNEFVVIVSLNLVSKLFEPELILLEPINHNAFFIDNLTVISTLYLLQKDSQSESYTVGLHLIKICNLGLLELLNNFILDISSIFQVIFI